MPARLPDSLARAERLTRLVLEPLDRDGARRLLSSLLPEQAVSDGLERILDLVSGNPLFAEEYVRLLVDRGLSPEADSAPRSAGGIGMPLPDTVQAVIAARLDALPASHKAVLCDAAVLGETFWDGGVMALSDRDRDGVDDVLAALIERQLVRPVRSSSLKDENEYLFWHALARDVAYEQLPRRARLRKRQDARRVDRAQGR